MRKFKTIAIYVAVLVAGVVIGSASAGAGETSEPEVVEKIVEVPTEVVVTETVEVPVTPQACLDFINTAREINDLSAQMAFTVQDLINAVITYQDASMIGDVAGMEDGAAQLNAVNADMESLNADLETKVGPFNDQATACQAGG